MYTTGAELKLSYESNLSQSLMQIFFYPFIKFYQLIIKIIYVTFYLISYNEFLISSIKLMKIQNKFYFKEIGKLSS